MIELKGKRAMTFEVSGETTKVTYSQNHSLDIYNASDSDILVSTENSFDDGGYLVIPGNNGYNGLRITGLNSASVYIQSNGNGKVSIVCGMY